MEPGGEVLEAMSDEEFQKWLLAAQEKWKSNVIISRILNLKGTRDHPMTRRYVCEMANAKPEGK